MSGIAVASLISLLPGGPLISFQMCFSYKPALECAFISIFLISVVFLTGCFVFGFFSWLFCGFFFLVCGLNC